MVLIVHRSDKSVVEVYLVRISSGPLVEMSCNVKSILNTDFSTRTLNAKPSKLEKVTSGSSNLMSAAYLLLVMVCMH